MGKHDVGSMEHLAACLRSLVNGEPPKDFGRRIQRAAMEREAGRLIALMEALDRGEVDGVELAEAWEIAAFARCSGTVREASCAIRFDRLLELDPTGAAKGVDMLQGWVASSEEGLTASLLFLVESEMDLTRHPDALRLAIAARRAGWRVAVVPATDDRTELVRLELRSADGDAVSLTAAESSAGSNEVTSNVRLAAAESAGPAVLSGEGRGSGRRELDLPTLDGAKARVSGAPQVGQQSMSVSDLFSENIMLRDIEPRSASLEGIADFRDELGWDAIYVPRKNESAYAGALLRIMECSQRPAPERIVYVGDTLLNDGGAIRGLQERGPAERVWGFLCGAIKAKPEHDFALGRIYFGADWTSLASFMSYAREDGLVLDESTWVLFDLDQTVYAAKGRDDESLVRARWDAVRTYLESVVPEYRFDPDRAEGFYREFDRDEYHPVTRDNLDYVVLLILAVSSGLADATELRRYASSTRPSIAALAEELRHRASMRVDHEDIASVLEAVKAVYYNTRAGDQTPCKDFRRQECLTMAARMRGEAGDGEDGQIFLNREVVDLIEHVRGTPAELFAVSDRPVEAAVAEHDGRAATDLMTVPMAVRGNSLAGRFE